MKNKEQVVTSESTLDKEFYNIPLFGEVRIDKNNSFNGNYDLGEIITNSKNNFQRNINMRAADDGLSGIGIFRNDFLTVDLNIQVSNGDIAVIKLGSKIYVRKIFFDKKRIRLEKENNTPAPLIIDQGIPGFKILGKVTTVIREL